MNTLEERKRVAIFANAARLSLKPKEEDDNKFKPSFALLKELDKYGGDDRDIIAQSQRKTAFDTEYSKILERQKNELSVHLIGSREYKAIQSKHYEYNSSFDKYKDKYFENLAEQRQEQKEHKIVEKVEQKQTPALQTNIARFRQRMA